jgi:hypothetical protein
MKKLFFVLLLITAASCNQEHSFTGYLVAKEYTPEHMCHDNVKTQSFAVVVPHVVHTPKHSHSKVEERYVWFVANKHRVREFKVSINRFHTAKCGDKVTMTW